MAAALALVLVLGVVAVLALAASPVSALPLSGRRTAPTGADGRLDTGRSVLQEVAPPLAVQQLQDALDGRRPRVEILSPADGALLPAGPWSLRLRVEDWPLVDAGPLGLGPHLAVQLDGDPPLTLTTTTTTMRALEPGSHRLTVYAARPWGEAVKSPGAQRQIQLHRVAANPLGQPAPGSPQLIAVSPRGRAAGTPLLLDWLLIDAPLQNLRAGDASWRLRVSVNGDSFLVDHQTPLWLEGWRSGSNAIQLELLDAIGEPLNPPFNSLVEEVTLEPGGERPRWQGGRLDPIELAGLLGEAPPAVEPSAEPEPEETEETGGGAPLEGVTEPGAPAASEPLADAEAPGVAGAPAVEGSTAVDQAMTGTATVANGEAAAGAATDPPSNVEMPVGIAPEAADAPETATAPQTDTTSETDTTPQTDTEQKPLPPPPLPLETAIPRTPESLSASPPAPRDEEPLEPATEPSVLQEPPAMARAVEAPAGGDGRPGLLESLRRRLAP